MPFPLLPNTSLSTLPPNINEDTDYAIIPENHNDSVEPPEPLNERPLIYERLKLNELRGSTIHNRRLYNSNEYSANPKSIHHYSNST